MWVGTEPDNVAALATYRSAGATSSNPFVVLTWDFDPVEESLSPAAHAMAARG
jgi:hypothetical protein